MDRSSKDTYIHRVLLYRGKLANIVDPQLSVPATWDSSANANRFDDLLKRRRKKTSAITLTQWSFDEGTSLDGDKSDDGSVMALWLLQLNSVERCIYRMTNISAKNSQRDPEPKGTRVASQGDDGTYNTVRIAISWSEIPLSVRVNRPRLGRLILP